MGPHDQTVASSTAGDPCLEVREFVRQYTPDVIVGPISFQVGEGEFFSLLGPSGCGKTTTLRAIAGFERVDGGEILLRGAPLHRTPANRRGVGLVFQRHALFPHLRVRDNVAFGLRQQRVAAAERAERVGQVLEMVGLSELADRWPAQLSGGQQQRVALARSLVMEPPVLLLDEPLSSLDLKLRVQMREEIRRLQKRLNKTTIFVTHDQTEALAMSDRVAVLSDGRIEQIGTPREIYNFPRTRFVAEFIGRSNCLTVSDLEHQEGTPIATTKEGLRLRLCPGKVAKKGALLFIRPERVRFAESSMPEALNVFAATIVEEEYLGDDIEYRLQTDAGARLQLTKKITTAGDLKRSIGPCQIAIDPEAIYVVD